MPILYRNALTILPCGKIVLCQAYDHIMETLTPGSSWQQFGFFKCITTTESQKEYISKIMRNISINVIKVVKVCMMKF